MNRLIPFNRTNSSFVPVNTGFENFYNMLDDFFSDSFMPNRNLIKDTFKMDIVEKDTEYLIEAELPGIKKEEIDLNIDDNNLCIAIQRVQENSEDNKDYVHRERRISSMSRRVRLEKANLNEIKAKLEDGILTVTIPKQAKEDTSRKISIE